MGQVSKCIFYGGRIVCPLTVHLSYIVSIIQFIDLILRHMLNEYHFK